MIFQLHRYVFKRLRNDSFKSIQLYTREVQRDAIIDDNTIVPVSPLAKTYALILLHKCKYLIQYSLLENRPRKLSLIMKATYFNRPYEHLIAAEITMKNDHELLIKDYSNRLWTANLNNMQRNRRRRSNAEDQIDDLFMEVKFLGSLLGTAIGTAVPMVGDQDNTHYLYYYLPRDGAVVRWNFRYTHFLYSRDYDRRFIMIIFSQATT